jgi:hypothetical protein
MINQAKLAAVNPKVVGPASMAVIDRIQSLQPEVQAAALGMAFVLLCRKLRVHAGDVLGVSRNLINHASQWCPEIKAAELYVENEIR